MNRTLSTIPWMIGLLLAGLLALALYLFQKLPADTVVSATEPGEGARLPCAFEETEPNERISQARQNAAPCLDTAVRGTLPGGDGEDLYRVLVEEEALLQARLYGMGGDSDFDLHLYNGAAERIATSDSHGPVDESFELPVAPGVYYFRILPFVAGSSAEYVFEWHLDPALAATPVTATTIPSATATPFEATPPSEAVPEQDDDNRNRGNRGRGNDDADEENEGPGRGRGNQGRGNGNGNEGNEGPGRGRGNQGRGNGNENAND